MNEVEDETYFRISKREERRAIEEIFLRRTQRRSLARGLRN
jgi:hypothetical protein